MPSATQNLIARATHIVQAGIAASATALGRHRIDEMSIHAQGFSEPGYGREDNIVVLGDFNPVVRWNDSTHRLDTLDDTPERVAADLERLGVRLEWEDQWTVCAWCGRLVRAKADSWSWKPSYWQNNGKPQCHECVRKDPTDYLRTLEGNDESAATLDLDFEALGYVLVQDGYEHGLNPGQDADAELIAEALRAQGVRRFIFRLDQIGQFHAEFSVLVHQSEFRKLDLDAFLSAKTNGPSVSEGLRKSLEDAGGKMAKLPSGIIKVARCDVGTGTARVRAVSPQQFLDGKALD
jgi:hypothetical protein